MAIYKNIEGKTFHSKILRDAVGNHHDPAMQRIIMEYKKSVDNDIYNFVQDVLNGRDVLPVTVGYLSQEAKSSIEEVLGKEKHYWFAPRCVLAADAVRHIIKRHGPSGTADHSLADINDIARMPYVFANFDKVEFTGKYTKAHKNRDNSMAQKIMLSKRIDGTYYIIEAVCDAKANKSYVVSAFLRKPKSML